MLCANNPTVLSRIVASSGTDLEPVHVERLSASRAGSDLLASAPGQATDTGGTEAYELARRLVSSAGAGGSGSSGSSSYTSAARKVRVSVKIPDRSPEDLPAGWDTDLQINGQRESALVLFTYMRRGCIQLVLDFLAGGLVGAGAPGGALRRGAAPPRLPHPTASTGQRPPPPPCMPRAASALAPEAAAAAFDSEPSSDQGASTPRQAKTEGGPAGLLCPRDSRPNSADGAGVAGGSSDAVAPTLLGGHWLAALGDEGLMAGRDVTIQVGANVSVAHVPAGGAHRSSSWSISSGTSRSCPPAMPPNVRVEPQVVCTAGAWRTAGLGGTWAHVGRPCNDVVVSCCWEAPGGKLDAVAAEPRGPELQLTARQQGRFLPVAKVATGEGSLAGTVAAAARTELSRGAAYVAVGQVQPGGKHGGGKATHGHPGGGASGTADRAEAVACRLAFTPMRRDGLVQIELSRGGVHSAVPASVLLVSSAAVAYELQQLQALAGGGLHPCAPPHAAAEDVLRDLGVLLDTVPALLSGGDASGAVTECSGGPAGAAEGYAPEDLPLFEWAMCPSHRGVLGMTPTPVAVHAGVARRGFAATACGAGAAAKAAAARYQSHDWYEEHRQQHVLAVATASSRLGFNLLTFFLSHGLDACAGRVLEHLHGSLGIPASMVAGYVCPEGLSLLHHSARSGSFACISGLANWLEAHGVPPGWGAPSAVGLTPLHLLAVLPHPEADVLAALVRLRWRAAGRLWRRRDPCVAGGCDASPADFAVMAGRPSSACQRAADMATALGVGSVWRFAAGLRRRVLPGGWRRGCWDAMAPSLAFAVPDLEASYERWLTGRTLVMDHSFLLLYAMYCMAHAFKHGLIFFRENMPGLALLAVRLVLLFVGSPVWRLAWEGVVRMLPRWAAGCARKALPDAKQQQGQEGSSGDTAADRGGTGGVPAARQLRTLGQLLVTREGRAVLMEAMRLMMMLALVQGLLPLPNSWRVLVQARLDWPINVVIRPTATQMRVLPTIMASGLAVVGESLVTVMILRSPDSRVPLAVHLALAFARGITTHGLGACVTLWLQGWSRGRFLELARGRKLRESPKGL